MPLNSLLNFHAFASSFSRDGELRINQDSIEFVGSLYSSGYHRTTAELSRRKTWREQNAGLIIQLNSKKYEFGIISALQDFSIPVLPRNTIYNSFDFKVYGKVDKQSKNWQYLYIVYFIDEDRLRLPIP